MQQVDIYCSSYINRNAWENLSNCQSRSYPCTQEMALGALCPLTVSDNGTVVIPETIDLITFYINMSMIPVEAMSMYCNVDMFFMMIIDPNIYDYRLFSQFVVRVEDHTMDAYPWCGGAVYGQQRFVSKENIDYFLEKLFVSPTMRYRNNILSYTLQKLGSVS